MSQVDEQEADARSGGTLPPASTLFTILGVLGSLALLIWLVTDNPRDVNGYVLATQWAPQLLGYVCLVLVVLGLLRVAVRDEPVDPVAWGLLSIIGLALVAVHWVAVAAIALVVIACVFFASRG